MRIVMVGTGRMATRHTEALAAMADVALDTVVGEDAATAAAFAEAQGYAHSTAALAEALARDAVDAVVICTPNQLHAAQTRAALEAGKHVLCEIPLALDLDEVVALGELAAAQDRRLMVCHTERFRQGRIALRQRIAAGELHPVQVYARFHMLRRGEVETAAGERGWQDNVLWHHGAHTVDGVLSLLGAPVTRGLAAQHGPPHAALEVPLDWALQWATPDGVPVQVSLSHSAHRGAHDYQFICAETTVVCDHGTLRTPDEVLVESDGEAAAIRRQDDAFVRAVREGRAPPVDVAAILPAMRVLQAAWDTFKPQT